MPLTGCDVLNQPKTLLLIHLSPERVPGLVVGLQGEKAWQLATGGGWERFCLRGTQASPGALPHAAIHCHLVILSSHGTGKGGVGVRTVDWRQERERARTRARLLIIKIEQTVWR